MPSKRLNQPASYFLISISTLLLMAMVSLAPAAGSGPSSAGTAAGAGDLAHILGEDHGHDHDHDHDHDLHAISGIDGAHLCILPFDENAPEGLFIPPPLIQSRAPSTADIQVNYIGPWTSPARQAFEFAVDIWEKLITSPVPIVVNAEFSSALPPGALGGAGPINYYSNFSGAPVPNTWYPVALANALHGADLNGATPEIDSIFSSTFDWYYGTDGQTPSGKVDFITVVLHEIAHGLGFAGSAVVFNNQGYWGDGTPYPDRYDQFAENLAGTRVVSYPVPSALLANDLRSNNMFFDGPNANLFNGGGRVPLYAPATWQQGSSYSHLDEDYNGTINDLMTFSVGSGTAIHNPGPVTLGLLKDIGWTVQTAPYIAPLPGIVMEKNSGRNNAFNLNPFVTDGAPDESLTYSIAGVSTANVTAVVDGQDNVDLTAANSWTGTATVTVRAVNPAGFAAERSFSVQVLEELFEIYLSPVIR